MSLIQGSALQIEDMYKKYSHLFSTKAKCVFITKKVTNTITQRMTPTGSVFEPVEYFGVRCDKADEAEAMLLIAKAVNLMIGDGYVTGVLSPPVAVDLATPSLAPPEMCIVFYFAIHHEYAANVKSKFKAFAANNGDMPEKFETLKRYIYDYEFTKELEGILDVV